MGVYIYVYIYTHTHNFAHIPNTHVVFQVVSAGSLILWTFKYVYRDRDRDRDRDVAQ